MIRNYSKRPIVRPFSRHTGVTMVEMLAAIVLATLLTVAMLGVLKSMTHGRKVLLADVTSEPWHTRLIDQLEWDLKNSRTIKPIPGGFELTGYAGRDFSDGRPLHRATTIQYVAVTTEHPPLLLRHEIHGDSLNLDNRATEVVGINVGRLVLLPADEMRSFDPDYAADLQNGVENGPLPNRVTAFLVCNGDATPLLQKTFYLR
ncbi:hypothetical protein Mal52_30420 [Symmachiella dynata]|uniref:Prepilin-type N-terminal cleavage/methylation domain-containing protein n=1 Tax=Symmachiella dynata TaxID=2527995 RepID=A0A517ZQ06_9PLAN|nr:hypothetical protein [Symmachiella dynata]QDU44558.1 hypothetical protein Mal52_30420 [Symmachiella dynata]